MDSIDNAAMRNAGQGWAPAQASVDLSGLEFIQRRLDAAIAAALDGRGGWCQVIARAKDAAREIDRQVELGGLAPDPRLSLATVLAYVDRFAA